MTRTIVCDASAVVAMLVDGGEDGKWAAETLTGARLAAPNLLRFEVANVLRRHERAGLVSSDQAALAHNDLVDLPIESWSYEPLAARVWALRENLSAYDASYVALAELIDGTLVTLDTRIGRAPDIRCSIATPPLEAA